MDSNDILQLEETYPLQVIYVVVKTKSGAVMWLSMNDEYAPHMTGGYSEKFTGAYPFKNVDVPDSLQAVQRLFEDGGEDIIDYATFSYGIL